MRFFLKAFHQSRINQQKYRNSGSNLSGREGLAFDKLPDIGDLSGEALTHFTPPDGELCRCLQTRAASPSGPIGTRPRRGDRHFWPCRYDSRDTGTGFWQPDSGFEMRNRAFIPHAFAGFAAATIFGCLYKCDQLGSGPTPVCQPAAVNPASINKVSLVSFCLSMLFALCLDRLIGWPDGLYQRLSHPVVGIGRLISWCDASSTARHMRHKGVKSAVLSRLWLLLWLRALPVLLWQPCCPPD